MNGPKQMFDVTFSSSGWGPALKTEQRENKNNNSLWLITCFPIHYLEPSSTMRKDKHYEVAETHKHTVSE